MTTIYDEFVLIVSFLVAFKFAVTGEFVLYFREILNSCWNQYDSLKKVDRASIVKQYDIGPNGEPLYVQ